MGWIESADGRDISPYGDMGCTTEENRTVGRLFAAAPELLDLAKEMVACLDDRMIEAHDSGGLTALGITHADTCSLCKARRVIAKAEGRS